MRASTLKPPMRKPQARGHVIETKAPPMGGLDSISPLALMPEANAVQLDNFISADSGLAVREGWYDYATNLGAEVRTILSYDAAPANAMVSPMSESELFAATDNGIFLVEGGGDMTGEAPDIALSGAIYAGRLSSVQFTTNGGHFLVACSEIDGGHLYDGAAWLKMTTGGTAGPGVVTGIDPGAFVQAVAWKHRLGFVERASTVSWWLPIDSVGGTAEPFDFGPAFPNGGALLALVNWTQDAGAGIDDRLVAISSAGDLVVYEGTDPTSAADFRMVGTWYIGQPPTGRRCFTTSGGNVYVLTQLGLMPVSQIVSGGLDTVETSSAGMLQKLRLLQDKLAQLFAHTINTPGWELLSVPAKSLFLVAHPPESTAAGHTQYVFNRHTLAWAHLRDIPGVTFAQRLTEVYAGTSDGRVLRVLDGTSDGRTFDGSGGQHVRARVTPAFSYFGAPDVLKQALMIRPVFLTRGALSWDVRMNVDYYIAPGSLTPLEQEAEASRWDSAIWDQSQWAASLRSAYEWRGIEGLGYALAPTLFVSSKGSTVLTALEYMMRAGGPL